MNTKKFHLARRNSSPARFIDQLPCRGSDVQERLRNFNDLLCTAYFQHSFSIPHIWNMELYFPDIACHHTDDPETFLLPWLLFSFVVGIGFGKMLDVHNCQGFQTLPNALPLNAVYFVAGFALMCFGICLANNCMLPIIPTDTFPRDLSEILSQKYKSHQNHF